jgi:hypothetical protein
LNPVNIICMKWGTKYSADYVNKLRRMVARHLSLPHRFICFTDDASGFDSGIEVFPLPSMPVDIRGPERGWNKVLTFSETLYDIRGTCLFLDLDLLIVGSLDDFFAQPGEVLIIRDWLKRDGTGNSSVYRFEAGKHADVLEKFIAAWPQVKQQYRNEQEFISDVLLEKNALSYWPETWCRSFKRHCLWPFPFSLFRVPKFPPLAKIIVFHGHPHPHEAIVGRAGKWYRFMRPTPWVEEFWG